METAELLLDCRNQHGEGIIWNPDDGRVWWTDIYGKRMWWFEPTTRRSGNVAMSDRVCCFAPRRNGGFIVAFAKGIAFFDPEVQTIIPIHSFELDKPETCFNDGRTDRQGRFIAGGMNEVGGEEKSSVLRVDADGSVTTILTGIGCANSICFSPDGRHMYIADSLVGKIWTYDYDILTGTPSNRRTFKEQSIDGGTPDGSCVDSEGAVWNAEWNGRRVVRVLPDGKIDRVVCIPVLKPTCCTFGGRDLDTLFITTSRQQMTSEQLIAEQSSGSLFSFKPGVCGLRDTPFSG